MQTSTKLATWQKKLNIQSSWNASETHCEMSSLLVVVKSHLFLALVHNLSIRVGREARWRQSLPVRTGERGEVAAINRGERAWHSGEKQGDASYIQPLLTIFTW